MMTAALILLALALALTLAVSVMTLMLMRDQHTQVREYIRQSELRVKRLTSRVRELEVMAGLKPPVNPYVKEEEKIHEQIYAYRNDHTAGRHAAGAVRNDNH